MRYLFKKVLRQLCTSGYLDKNFYFDDDLVDKFLEQFIFTSSEKDDVDVEKTNKHKIIRMVEILAIKTDDVYDTLKQCLHDDHQHVVDEMLKLEKDLDKECENCLESICRFLESNYKESKERKFSKAKLSDVQNTITNHVRASKRFRDTLTGVLDEDLMIQSLKKTFPSSDIETMTYKMPVSPKSKGGKMKSPRNRDATERFVTGIEPRSDSQRSRYDSSESSSSETDEGSDAEWEEEVPNQKQEYLNVDEFAQFTSNILQNYTQQLDSTTAEKIKQNEIDSEVFEMMSENDRNKIFPKIGERIRIEKEWQNFKIGKSEIKINKLKKCYEHIRRFDRPASEGLKYKQNAHIYCSVSRPGNLITPVHKYVDLSDYGSKVPWEQKLVHFSAACMNDRTNGTFYVGITESGIIKGCDLDIVSVDCKLIDIIKESFKEHQIETALKCIRPPQFIEVIRNTTTKIKDTLHVIEIDVVPYSEIVRNQIFSIKNQKSKDYVFYRYQDGKVKKLSSRKIAEYLQHERESLLQQRIMAEKTKPKHRNENLDKRLTDFFCCGEENYEESLYPVLVLSHIPKSEVEQIAEGQLFRDVPWRSVLDFNQKNEECGLQVCLEKRYSHTFLTYVTDDFNQRKKEEKTVKLTLETLTQSPIPAWIYCNEVGEEKNSARNWVHMSAESFRKALEFYSDLIPDGRGRIVIPLFEKENSELTEAICEILLKFGKQVLILSPNRSIAAICYEELSRRPTTLPPSCTVDDFFLTGLQWHHVNECVSRILKSPNTSDGIQIPRSNGGIFTMSSKVVKELSDIEIVAVNECENLKTLSDEEKNIREQEVREDYYQGGAVQWQNFYFQSQVLVRDVHKNLEKYVRQSLEENDNEAIAVDKVAVYHQPGSGGSTTSRNILWNLRSEYRCCVVKNISNQTCDQIGRFRTEGEKDDDETDIKPVLVLLDSNNDESIAQFVDDLENESRKHDCDLFCVLLICFRVSALPLDRPTKFVMLRQELSTGENSEHNWFKAKYQNLLEKFKSNRGCNPHTLLGFNIMKENFSMESINKSVKEFVSDGLITAKHRKLLKHLSFFNGYDLHFQSIPISCFDPIMSQTLQWTKHFPPSMRVLTSRCRKQGYGGYCSAIRMSNYLLSKPVLNAGLEIEKKLGIEPGLTVGEVALDVMNSDCFRVKFYKHENRLLKNILSDIVRKRDRCSKTNGKIGKFSPLITELLDQKDSDQALEIVALAYAITDDPLVAQQLARLNAELKNWQAAHKAIDVAILKKPHNSYILHTKGQLFKDEMLSSFSHFMKEGAQCPLENIDTAITLSRNAIESFRQSQTLRETHNVAQQDSAGYESEILMTIELLRLLSRCRDIQPKDNFVKLPLQTITSENVKFMRNLSDIFYQTVENLERNIYGINRNQFHSTTGSLYIREKKQLDKHRKEFVQYFALDHNQIEQKHKNPLPQIDIWSLLSAMRYADGKTLIETAQAFSCYATELRFNNIRIFLAMSIAISLRNPAKLDVDPTILLSLSRKYFIDNKVLSELASLEKYLYFVSFHWPMHLTTRQNYRNRMSPFSIWIKAVEDWLRIENKTDRRNDKILFYLGNANAFPSFVKIENASSLAKLAQFEGMVNCSGTKVTITGHSAIDQKIVIPFHRPLRRNTILNRQINVIIGFGLNGPRADWLEKPSSFNSQIRTAAISILKGAPEAHQMFSKITHMPKGLLDVKTNTLQNNADINDGKLEISNTETAIPRTCPNDLGQKIKDREEHLRFVQQFLNRQPSSQPEWRKRASNFPNSRESSMAMGFSTSSVHVSRECKYQKYQSKDTYQKLVCEIGRRMLASEQQAIREQITRPPPPLMTNPHVNTFNTDKNFQTGENSLRNLDFNRYPPRKRMESPSQSPSEHGSLPYSQKQHIDSSLLFCPPWERYQPPHSNRK